MLQSATCNKEPHRTFSGMRVWVFPQTFPLHLFQISHSSLLPQQTPSSSHELCRLHGIISCDNPFRFHTITILTSIMWGHTNSREFLWSSQRTTRSIIIIAGSLYWPVLCHCLHKDKNLGIQVCNTLQLNKQNQSQGENYNKFHIYIKEHRSCSLRGPELKPHWTEANIIPVPPCSAVGVKFAAIVTDCPHTASVLRMYFLASNIHINSPLCSVM